MGRCLDAERLEFWRKFEELLKKESYRPTMKRRAEDRIL